MMRSSKTVWIFCLLAVFGMSLPAFAAFPVRQTSDNGQADNEDEWTLVGRTVPIKLTQGTNVVTMTRQIICPQQDRGDGGCTQGNPPGNYMFLFQLQSTSTNVPINIANLEGFTPGTQPDFNYGVMLCDSGNNPELCTYDPDNLVQEIGITFKQTSKTSVKFTIPSFPAFPPAPGAPPEEGQGLTLYIITQQSSALPIAWPTIGD